MTSEQRALSVKKSFPLLLALVVAIPASAASSQPPVPAIRVAVLGGADDAIPPADMQRVLSGEPGFAVLDASLVRSAVVGAGVAVSLNMTTEDARRVGAVTGAEVLVLWRTASGEAAVDTPASACFVCLLLVDGWSGDLLRYAGTTTAASSRGDAHDRLLAFV